MIGDPPVVFLPQGWEEQIAPIQRQHAFLLLIEALPANEEARAKLATLLNMDWTTFSRATASTFQTAATDRDLAIAIELWIGLQDAHMQLQLKEAAREESLRARRRRLNDAFGAAFPTETVVVTHDGRSIAQVRTSSAVGSILSCNAGPGHSPVPTPISVRGSRTEVALLKPKIVQIHHGTTRTVFIRSVETTFLLRPREIGTRMLYVLASRKVGSVHFDPEELPTGRENRLVRISGTDWLATFRIHEDSRLLIDSAYGELLRATVDNVDFSSVTVEGTSRSSFDLDLFQFFLFFAIGVEFRVLERQEIVPDDSIVGCTIVSERAKDFASHSEVHGWINGDRFRAIWTRVAALPNEGPSFLQSHFCVVVHAIIGALKQPLQKGIVDLYQVLDTLAQHHPDVPRTKMSAEEYSARKERQVGLLRKCRELLATTAEAASDLKPIEDMIAGQKNDFSVVQRVIKLLEACGAGCDQGDLIQKLSIDLRHRISHNLAAAKVGEDAGEFKLAQLVGVRSTLLRWALQCIMAILPAGSPS